MPDDTHMDLRERIAALEQMLAERTAERDEALEPAGSRCANGLRGDTLNRLDG